MRPAFVRRGAPPTAVRRQATGWVRAPGSTSRGGRTLQAESEWLDAIHPPLASAGGAAFATSVDRHRPKRTLTADLERGTRRYGLSTPNDDTEQRRGGPLKSPRTNGITVRVTHDDGTSATGGYASHQSRSRRRSRRSVRCTWRGARCCRVQPGTRPTAERATAPSVNGPAGEPNLANRLVRSRSRPSSVNETQ